MIAPTKRRHLFYYFSLPLVVAIVLLLVARLAALQRAEVVAELADQVAHHDTPVATAALRQLAAMPRPPVDILVNAASSADTEMAHEAQLLVSSLLRRWQRRIEADRGIAGVGRQLGELAEVLDKHHAAFSTGDHAWLRKTAQKIMRLSNRIPPPNSPLVAVHCDAVLATIAAREQTVAALVNRDLAAAQPPAITKVAAPAELIQDQRPATSPPQPAISPRPVSPFANSVNTADRDTAESAVGEQVELTPHIDQPHLPDAVNHSQRQPAWQYPGLNASPATPIDRRPSHAEKTGDDRSPAARFAAETSSPPVAPSSDEVSSRELLRQWLAADGSDVLPIETELTRRGFVRLSARLVEPLFSNDAEDRLRLVDDVLTEPGIDARPWLMLLAEDAHSDVRLLAVTIMATSDDPALIEKAWQVSIRDRDPRIAGLAGRLRERRGSAQRR